MELVYSQTRQPGGRKQLNPRFFDGVVEGASIVYIDGAWPQIEAAYAKAGVTTHRLDFVAPAYQFEMPPPEVREVPDIPADWRDLPWTQPDERGLTLRGLAAAVSDTTVINKAQAINAIESYLETRPD